MFDGQTVQRERRRRVASDYNPAKTVPAEWDDEPLVAQLPGAWIASSTGSAANSATRSQILTSKSLFLTDPAADVQPGDRILLADGNYGYVHVRPQADTNPFTGWQPVLEVPLEEVEG